MRFVFWKNNLRWKSWGDEMDIRARAPVRRRVSQWRGVEGMGQRDEKKEIDIVETE